MNRTEIADLILSKLQAEEARIAAMYEASKAKIGYFMVDDLLPAELAKRIFAAFPSEREMHLKKSIREYKYVAAQMNKYDPLLEEIVYAFQDPRVVSLIADVIGLAPVYSDAHLYAGGISLMGDKHFLNPHLDNSHDKNRERWCILNLLYYVTPDWPLENGGNLELWPEGVGGKQVVIHSKFNRLAVMATHDASWHSVSPIESTASTRRCVSNYYFADRSLKDGENFHVTAFRGRPEQKLTDLMLRADAQLRMMIRKVFSKGVVETKHVYKR
jgi:Rps23 Pro-64 3,4-dihydroxylase Tpa1-like proline 4-hydroxylase